MSVGLLLRQQPDGGPDVVAYWQLGAHDQLAVRKRHVILRVDPRRSVSKVSTVSQTDRLPESAKIKLIAVDSGFSIRKNRF
ncbi:hypothetical protein ACX1C1_26020 [Paenibacillus sp. strain BS8-2]